MRKDVSGDITEMSVELVLQQCNCLSIVAHGLSSTISDKLGVNIYSSRKNVPGRANLAIYEDRGIPGSSIIVKTSKGLPKYVACLLGQFSPGKPGNFYQDIVKKHGFKDNPKQRIEWFKESLEQLKSQIEELEIRTIAIPKYIGCGLAGGDPKIYEHVLNNFVESLYPEIIVYFVSYE